MAEGIERIKNLVKIETDKQVIKVAEYLITREDMDEKYLNENKNLGGMFKYITERAREHAEDGCAWVEDDTVYGWAIHYWDESEEDLRKEKINRDKLSKKETKVSKKETSEEKNTPKDDTTVTIEADENHILTKESYEQLEKVFSDNDIVFKYKGKLVTRKQFETKEFLKW